jgi:hypothetical protein
MEESTSEILIAVRDHPDSGIFGICARMCLANNDEVDAVQFIRELGEYTHIYSMRLFWGEELHNRIVEFCQKRGFDNPFKNRNPSDFLK